MSTPIIGHNRKTAIVLFNLGGPDSVEAVQPFLFNLFNDPAIIGLPFFLRTPLARLISKRRAKKKAIPIYNEMGGKSPILENTLAQAAALEHSLHSIGDAKVFVCMRYWHPMSTQVVAEVKDSAPDHIILLPLYPQFSTTTTASSVKDWHKAARKAGIGVPTTTLCCYPTQPEWIMSLVQLIRPLYEKACENGTPRILFSAHGLPEKIIRRGDPYQWQVEQTTKAVVDALGIKQLDYINCYQSRVGPLKWIGPNTETVLEETAARGQPVVLVPLAFVSEHSETLVELDIEYKELCENAGLHHYFRVPTVSINAHFIACLTDMCAGLTLDDRLCSEKGGRLCPTPWKKCPHA